jgi:2-polyprenyl-6-methoxyphenol hydroxylase-like FAD-dependent oxidoreductase
MKAIPRRLLVLGGGPVGVEMAQAVRRLGGEVAVIDMAEQVLAREPAPLGEALGEVLRREGIELVLSATRALRDATARTTSSSSTTGASSAATGCSSRPAGARASMGSIWRRSASSRTPTGSRSTRICARPSSCGRSAMSTASGR